MASHSGKQSCTVTSDSGKLSNVLSAPKLEPQVNLGDSIVSSNIPWCVLDQISDSSEMATNNVKASSKNKLAVQTPVKRRCSPRINFSVNSNNKAFDSLDIKIKQEPKEEDGDDIFHKSLLEEEKSDLSSQKETCIPEKKVKFEPNDSDTTSDKHEYTDAELRSHNLCDFLDNSPRIKQPLRRRRAKRKVGKKHSKEKLCDALPPLISMKDDMNPGGDFSLQQHNLKKCDSGVGGSRGQVHFQTHGFVRQSPRLRRGKSSFSDSDMFFSDKHEAVHLAQELNCLVAKASTFAQKLTDLVMESSMSTEPIHQYQDPPVLEPEAPIISPSSSRRSSEESHDIFSDFLTSSAPASRFPRARSKSFEEDAPDYKPATMFRRKLRGSSFLSMSDDFNNLRRNKEDNYGRAPLLQRDLFVQSEDCWPLKSNKEKVTVIPRDSISNQRTTHLPAGENIFLKTNYQTLSDENLHQNQSSGNKKSRQPKLIFRMKKDPELKKQIKAQSSSVENSCVQFVWDDDSDPDSTGFSPTRSGIRRRFSQRKDLIENVDSSSVSDSCQNSESQLSSSSTPNTESSLRKVRKVRLKMIDTSLHFDLVSSPSGSAKVPDFHK